jgi:hypothetical protein
LGGFFDGNALLRAKAQFKQLRRWVFRDCSDLSAGHLAALLAVSWGLLFGMALHTGYLATFHLVLLASVHMH